MHSVSMSDQQKVCVVEVVSIREIVCVYMCAPVHVSVCVFENFRLHIYCRHALTADKEDYS